MSETIAPITTGVTPHLMVRGASDAIEFYTRAFGAEELSRMPADDGKRLLHAHIRVNGADVMICDEFPEYGQCFGEPGGVTLHLAVDNADTWFDRALEAGCTVRMPIMDQFWGDRYGQLTDPFGHAWSIGSPLRK